MNLSTQFEMQLSSLPANLPPDTDPGMHFLKQVSVRLCIAASCQLKEPYAAKTQGFPSAFFWMEEEL
jgi:hypothetical protein